jgi:antitoxin VapB
MLIFGWLIIGAALALAGALTNRMGSLKIHTILCVQETIMQTTLSRVFMNGNSQAVRIPQEFRLVSNRVEISRNGDGDLVLHPLPADRGAALLNALNAFDDEFVGLLASHQADAQPMQDRAAL